MRIAAAVPLLLLALGAEAQEKPTEVVFVGTQHFISDMPEGYTPGHLRALLAKIGPAAIAVEAPSNVESPWTFAPLELSWVTKPWAEERKIPLVAVGWNDLFYGGRIEAMVGVLKKAGKGADYEALEARTQSELARLASCEDFNRGKGIDVWRRYHAELRAALGKDTPWDAWNAKIVENVRAFAKEQRGKRVAVVFGAAHAYCVIDALSKEEGVKVLPAESFFPLAPEAVAALTTPQDHLRALRQLNFGVATPEQLREAEKHLDRLKGLEEFRGDHALFAGKALLIKNDFEGAVARFEEAGALGDDARSRFDGQSRLNEMALLYRAIALARQGKPPEARSQLEALLKKPTLSPSAKPQIEQVLQQLGPR